MTNPPTGQLQLPGQPLKLAPEVWLNLAAETHALHPQGWQSPQKIVLDNWPDREIWQSLLAFFPVADQRLLAAYFSRLQAIAPAESLTAFLQALAPSAPESQSRELLALSALPGQLALLHSQKNIPLKLLQLLLPVDSQLQNRLAELLLPEYIKNNMAREIVRMWADLPGPLQKQALAEMSALAAGIKADGRLALAALYRQKVFALRYPVFLQHKTAIDQLLKHTTLPARCQLSCDEFLEKTSISLQAELRSTAEVENLCARLLAQKETLSELFSRLGA